MKSFAIKILTLILFICGALSVFTACGEEETPQHTHVYNIAKYDNVSHWYECECGAFNEKQFHTISDDRCVCGWEIPHKHYYNTLKYDTKNHWYECACGDKKDVENHEGGIATETAKAVCEVCNQSYGEMLEHTHKYNTLKYDTKNHWYECSCGDKKDVENHKGGTATETAKAVCEVCNQSYGEMLEHTHKYNTLKYDAVNHWYECACGDKKDVENHKGGTATETAKAVCEVCSQSYGEMLEHTHKYNTLKYDTKNHWYECSCGDKKDVENHEGGIATETAKAVCEVCNQSYGELLSHTHKYNTLKFDTKSHWYECYCGDKNGVENHKGGTATETAKAVCTVCNQSYGELLNHTHDYKTTTVLPKCEEQGYTLYTCNCGDSYKDNYVNQLNHSYTNYVFNNDAKCEENGTETAVCDNGCGKSDTRVKENSALSHSYTNYVYNNDAKCEENGTETAVCDNGCGKSDTRVKENSALSHSYTNYVYNNDAKCEENGTKTAVCNNGCGKSDTRVKENSALSHSYTNYVYNNDAKCEENGTETALCDNSCGKSDSRIKNDTALEHSFTKYYSDKNATYEQDGTKTATCDNGCGKTHTVADVGSQLQVDEIRFNTLAVDGKNVYGKVSNATTEFVFYEEIFVSGNATYVVDNDKDCSSPIDSKTVDLAIGDNTFYVLEKIGSNIKLYTVIIHRREMFTVTFNTNGGTAVDSQIIEEDSFATVPTTTTTKTGYTFTEWDYDFNTAITKDTVVNAEWSINQYTITIVYNNGQKDLVLTQDYNRDIANISNPTKTGYSFAGWDKTIPNEMPAEHLTINATWQINQYTLTIVYDNGQDNKVITQDYNSDIESIEIPTKDGYIFTGWSSVIPTKMPSQNITITARWKAKEDTKYVVEYYLQNIDDNNYTLSIEYSYETVGTTDTKASVTPETIEYFTFNKGYSNNKLSGNIDGKGTLVLKVYYTRNVYTLSNDNSSIGSISNSGSYKYGKALTATATPYLGYDLVGWYNGETLLSTDLQYNFTVDKDVTAKFTIKEEMANFNFTSTETTCEITGIKDKTVTELIIPNYVTTISQSAFSDCIALREMTIPFVGATLNGTSYTYFGYIFGASDWSYNNDYVPTLLKTVKITGGTSIGYNAFRNCYSLTNIVIPNSVTSIGNCAFYDCKSLTGIVIPYSVESIGGGAFRNCTSLTSIEVSKNNQNYKSIDANLYSKDGKTLVQYAIGKTATTFTIPNSVTNIGDSAFYGCSSLTSIGIPNNVLSIGSSSFYNCSSLTSVTFGENSQLTSIGWSAFESCTSLTSIEIPNSVISINFYAFKSCTSLTSIEIPNSETGINKGAFESCTSLESITIPSSTYFGYIFGASDSSYNNDYVPTSLKTVKITGGTSIGEYAFYNCSSITSIEIPNSVTSIGNCAFYNCKSLTGIVIPYSVESIGHDAFHNCTSLTNIVIPISVESIGHNAFYNCSSLTIYCVAETQPSGWDSKWNYNNQPVVWNLGNNDVADDGYIYTVVDGLRYGIKDGVATIVQQPKNISTANIKENISYKGVTYNVTSIGEEAFCICYSLTSVVIGNNVISVGDYAFSGCDSLTSVVIGNNVISVGNYAFSGCDSLTSVVIGNSVKSIGEYAFQYCESLTSVVIGNSVTSIGNYAFQYCKSLTSVVIGNSVTSIGNYAFRDCTSLESVVMGNSVSNIGDGAFYYCYSLTSIEIPNSVTRIGYASFYNCDSLTNIIIPNSVTNIGGSAFRYCDSLESIIIPNSVTSIGSEAFNQCNSLTIYCEATSQPNDWSYSWNSSNLPVLWGYTYVEEDGLIYGIKGGVATVVSQPWNIKTGNIKDYITYKDKTYTVTSIGSHAFSDCDSLESVVIGNNVTSIGNYAFRGCSSLTSVVIGNSVTSIGVWAFYNCDSLTSINYNGTIAQWDAISKGSGWANFVNATVYCSDGNITIYW